MLYQNLNVENICWSVEIDLVQDYREHMANSIKRMGYTYSSIQNAPIEFFNIKKMLIPVHPRKVEYSKEFICPNGYEQALSEFVDRIEKGQSLRPFQSSGVKRANNKDLLLSDWNIHHFHLTRQFHDDGFAKRSQFQIFAYITDDTVYLIQIYNHNTEHLYCLQEMVRIIYDNWSGLIEKNRIPGAVALTEDINDEVYEELRKAHVSTMVDLGEGNVYGLIGGGYASDGTSLEAVRNADFWHNRMKEYENHIITNIYGVLNKIAILVGKDIIPHLRVKTLMITDERVVLYEKNNKIIFEINIIRNKMRICVPNDLFYDLSNSNLYRKASVLWDDYI